jgi:hypothetical protein
MRAAAASYNTFDSPMELEPAVQQYLIERKAKTSREDLEFELAVLARLQEFLDSEPVQENVEALRASDLRAFIGHWFRSAEDITPEAARDLAAAVVAFAGWVDRQSGPDSDDMPDDRGIGQSDRPLLAPSLLPLEDELPRAVRIADYLRRHVHRNDLPDSIPLEEAPGGSPLGTIGAGISRVLRPQEIDYSRAEEDTFRVAAVNERSVSLISPAREQMGEGPAAPVAVPVRAARLIRVDDILHIEIAPSAAGWEILNVEAVIPGGLDDRP